MAHNNSRGRKKSNFPASPTTLAGANLDFFVQGVNYKITYENFIAGLGVTGTLEQEGNVLGTPVLDIQGTVNNIRNLENGAGVKASVSPEGGITLEHNFTADNSGLPILANPALASPTIRSLIAGDGITVTKDSGNEAIVVGLGEPVATKTISVNTISDFPAAVGGVITLEPETDYFITNDITTDKRFIFGDATQIRSVGTETIALSYTGSGDMFTGIDVSFRIAGIALSCPTGTLLNVTDTVGNEKKNNVFLDTVTVRECDKAGVLTSLFALYIHASEFTKVNSNGFEFLGGAQGFGYIDVQWVDHTIEAGAMYDLGTAVFDGVSINNHINFLNGSSSFVSGLTGSANIAANSIGTITLGRFEGTGTPLNNITSEDSSWDMQLNEGIANTRPDALLTLRGNSTQTSINVNTPVKVVGTWVTERSSQFDVDSTGTSIYRASKPSGGIPITISGNVRVVSGQPDDIVVYLAINGSEIINSGAPTEVPTGSPGVPFSIVIWQEELQSGDELEMWIENQTNGTNVIVESATIRIN
jgi:hypothetical protein